MSSRRRRRERPPIEASGGTSRDALASALLVSASLFAASASDGSWSGFIVPGVFGALAFALSARVENRRWRELPRRLAVASLYVGLAALALPILGAGLSWWEDRAPLFRMHSVIASGILNVLGYKASESQGFLSINHTEGLVSILPSMEKVGARGFAAFVGLWLILRGVRDPRRLWRSLALVAATAFVLSLVRYAALIAVYLEFSDLLLPRTGDMALALLSRPWSVAPFLIIAGALLDIELGKGLRDATPSAVSSKPRPSPQTIAAVAVVCGVLGIASAGCALLRPPGEEKLGRVLIDDRFGGMWEPTARMLDTQWYGDFATYSFSSLAEWLGHWFAVDVNTSRQYDDGLLKSYDVLILKTPVEPIPQAEQDAIDRFVLNGGGLLLVGDHTNLLGMGAHLNQFCAQYGIKFRYDAVSDQSGGFVNCAGARLGRHPAAIQVENMEFMTSCSLEVSASAEVVLAADLCRRDPHDYANSSFFGRQGPHPELQQGRVVLCATASAGAGRIAAFTDSTVWSSFAVFQHDREKLAFDLVRWLNRKPSTTEPRLRLALVPILGALIVFVGFAIPFGGGFRLSILLSALSGVWLGAGGVEFAHRSLYQPPKPFQPVVEVAFLWQGGACAFPATLGTLGSLPADRAFDTFYVATQRLGLVPRVARTYDSALSRDAKALILIAPVDPPPRELLDRTRDFVARGGSLVVIDDSKYQERGSAKRWLAAMGMKLEYQRILSAVPGQAPRTQVVLPPEMPLVKTPDPAIYLGIGKLGEGHVVYLLDAPYFSRSVMGHSFARPWKRAQACYDAIYQLFRDHLKIAPQERRFYQVL